MDKSDPAFDVDTGWTGSSCFRFAVKYPPG